MVLGAYHKKATKEQQPPSTTIENSLLILSDLYYYQLGNESQYIHQDNKTLATL